MHLHTFLRTATAGIALLIAASASSSEQNDKKTYTPVGFSNAKAHGELRQRVLRNMDRLEDERYRPDHVFLTEQQSGYWPGDTEGRTILGLVMDAQAAGREPMYLDEIIRRIPAHLNERGYFGTIHKDSLDEQQLSGNGWVLRGLCEYYRWKNDATVLPTIKSISENLFVAGKDLIPFYPTDPAKRTNTVGGASGNVGETIGRWRLSTDVGCVFIGMDGLIHAYEVTGNERLRPTIDELIALFLKVDIVKIKAQTHASLTALRGLLRFAAITGDTRYIQEVEKRWAYYKSFGMTENYANYNWFRRYDTWTEPCAVVDSYIVAAQLWQLTGKAEYRDDAELIYFNAICHGQRANGGFGTDKCPGKGFGHPYEAVSDYEAWWCCTMRGGEGLGRAAEFTAFRRADEVAIPFFRNASVSVDFDRRGTLKLEESTNYPFDGNVEIRVVSAPRRKITLSFACTDRMEGYTMKINGHAAKITTKEGMARLSRKFVSGDKIEINFDMQPRTVKTSNSENNDADNFKVLCGPLLLAAPDVCESGIVRAGGFEPLGNCNYRAAGTDVILSPLYHLMSDSVSNDAQPPYARRVIF